MSQVQIKITQLQIKKGHVPFALENIWIWIW